MSGTLYVVATPIGNLSDITFRAIETLKSVAAIAAEDTRVTQKLLNRFEISTPLVSYREQNADRIVPELIQRLQAGDDIAVVSDAGTPSISDPGTELVFAAFEAGIRVSPIPGVSAMSAALSVCALPGDGARFLGFLPRKGRDRKERIRTIAQDPSCTILYESPHRLRETLKELHKEFGDRQCVVFRELTKLHEEIKRGTPLQLADYFSGDVRGEITLVIEGNRSRGNVEITDDKLELLIQEELKAGRSAKDIASALSTALGISKKKIYDMVVGVIQRRGSDS